MDRKICASALFLGATAIILGAFGAHGLKKLVTPEAVASFEIGVRYQMYHALFLLFIGSSSLLPKQKKIVFLTTILGVFFFSGSIYGLTTNGVQSFFDFKKIALITPVGGMFFIVSWVLAMVFYMGKKK